MENLTIETEIRDIRKALITQMLAADPKLFQWFKGFVKVYGG